MYRDDSPLFNSGDGPDAMRRQIASACAEVDGLAEERLLNTDVDALVAYFADKYSVDVPVLDRDNLTGAQHERQIEIYDQWNARMMSVPGVVYEFELPFTGDGTIFGLTAGSFDGAPPRAKVNAGTLGFSIAAQEPDPERIKAEIDRFVASVERYLGWHRTMWSNYPPRLARDVRQRIEDRRARLLKQKEAASQLAGLGIKLREKPGDARTYVPPSVRQIIEPKLPPMRPSAPPEPTLDKAQYEIILGLIRDAGHSVEQSSSRMRELGEEALRDIFLVPLNAHFGSATGEAFNHHGKTDILIKHEGGNLFVAEFKIWGGEKHFLATIDQLLRYLTWRDTKTAIVIFSRRAGFSAVVAKIREAAQAHPLYVSGPVRLDETSDSFEFSLPQDADRRVTLSILAFDLGG